MTVSNAAKEQFSVITIFIIVFEIKLKSAQNKFKCCYNQSTARTILESPNTKKKIEIQTKLKKIFR